MAGKLMRALVFGGTVGGVVGVKHTEVPIPKPHEDEVLIKVEAVSLNPVDWKIHKLRALLRPFIARNSPLIPSTDVAGEVVEIGSQVKSFKAGDKVVAVLGTLKGGGLAEYAVAKEIMTVSRPEQVSAAEASGIPIAGLTAHLALTRIGRLVLDKTGPQKNVLITAASGGVGHYAVQLAKLGNNHVTATCGARNLDFVKSLGADEALDYRTEQGSSLVSPSGKKYDVVLHCGPAVAWSVFEPNLSEDGLVIDLTPGAGTMCTYAAKVITRSKKRMVPYMLIPGGDHSMKYLLELMRDGKLKTVIDSKYDLSRCEEAWSKSIAGHATGKIVVEV